MSFQQFKKSRKKQGASFDKVLKCCSFPQTHAIDWVWIDTCCIDKKSSAELSEAINSMYRWYERAEVCYAYLSDVRCANIHLQSSRAEFRNSVWFTRGWTLQELLAPSKVIFVNYEWEFIRTKYGLSSDISVATGIDPQYLRGIISRASVATEMSWISKRTTTRLEDMAYCLLGIFDVNMSLLYGEGRKAFYRLQLEIINKSDDESIFAWTTRTQEPFGMLAPWPSFFENSGCVTSRGYANNRLSYRMTNRGLELHLPPIFYSDSKLSSSKYNFYHPENSMFYKPENIIFSLNCQVWEDDDSLFRVKIHLKKNDNGSWYRVDCDKLEPSIHGMVCHRNTADDGIPAIYIPE